MIIGILSPSSNVYPHIGADFIDGIRSLLHYHSVNTNIQLVVEGIGFGGIEKEVYLKTEKLLRIDKVDIVIAFVDMRVLPIIEPLVYSLDKLLIIVNSGANYPLNWTPQPTTIHLGLHHAFLSYLTGILAAEDTLKAQAAVATSYYDCGYLHIAAMTNAFTANGGNIQYNFIHPQSYTPFNIDALTSFLTEHNTVNQLLCLFDQIPAAFLYKALSTSPLASALQLFVSPMMLEDKALSFVEQGVPFSVAGYSSWFVDTSVEQSGIFTSTLSNYAKKDVSLFALLGWEVGQLLHQLTLLTSWTSVGINEVIDQLKQTRWQTPRGITYLDDSTHYLLHPVTQIRIDAGQTYTQILPLAYTQKRWSEFTAIPADAMSSGWTNTYLCY